MSLTKPRRFQIEFHRACPHGIGIGRKALTGTIHLWAYDADEAAKAARFVLDGFCVIDSVEALEQQ